MADLPAESGPAAPPARPTVLVVGASARAAAWSAVRAGLSPSAADLFADVDLAAVAARSVRVPRGSYPDGLAAAAAALPGGPWLYTGAVENRPDLIARLARARPLWGNDAVAVRAARDPFAVADALRDAGLPAAGVSTDPARLPRDGSWLRKPLASAAGRGIMPLVPGLGPPPHPSYYQQRNEGLSLSGVYLGTRDTADLVGVTRQLTGHPGAPFAYRGTVAPWPVGAGASRRIAEVGAALASRFGLVGLFGVDLILDRDGVPWVVEVNPRYTASVETLELALFRPLLDDHRRCCLGLAVPPRGPTETEPRRYVAKEVIFAGSAGAFPGVGRSRMATADDPFRVPEVADVPRPGTPHDAGNPVLTVFAEGTTPDDALRGLAGRRAAWRDALSFMEFSY